MGISNGSMGIHGVLGIPIYLRPRVFSMSFQRFPNGLMGIYGIYGDL